MRTIVILNEAAGGARGDSLARAREAVQKAGIQAEVRPVARDMMPAAIAEAAAAPELDAVFVAGGDGTVSTAASVMAGGEKPLGVLPMGTLNHFARDLGLPPDPDGAAALLAAGRSRNVDLGEVNGRLFVNNCSVGLYPEAVRRRESHREKGTPKWPAMLRAMREALRRLPLLRLTLRTDDETLRVTTPLLVIGNNRYETDALRLGQRRTLEEGQLWVYLARLTGAGAVVKLGLRALAGRLEQTRGFESLSTTTLRVDDRRRHRHLTVALDGELDEIEPPLVLRSRPRSLRVLVPSNVE